jgi:hypothetical protein
VKQAIYPSLSILISGLRYPSLYHSSSPFLFINQNMSRYAYNEITSWSRVPLEKLRATTPPFTEAMFTRACHWSLSWARCIHSTPSHSYFPKIHHKITLPSTSSFPSGFSLRVFQPKFCMHFSVSTYTQLYNLSLFNQCETRTSIYGNVIEWIWMKTKYWRRYRDPSEANYVKLNQIT